MNEMINRKNVLDIIKDIDTKIIPWAKTREYTEECLRIIIEKIKELPPAEREERIVKVHNQIFNNPNPNTVGAWIGTCECGSLVAYSSKYCSQCGGKLEWNDVN